MDRNVNVGIQYRCDKSFESKTGWGEFLLLKVFMTEDVRKINGVRTVILFSAGSPYLCTPDELDNFTEVERVYKEVGRKGE